MNKKNFYKLELLSLIRIAASLWESPDVKQKILKYGMDVDKKQWIKSEKAEKWRNIVKYVTGQAESLQLPAKLLPDVQSMIVLTGEKYFTWFNHVIKDGIFDIELMPTVCWTPYGTVDEVEVLREIIRKNPNFSMNTGSVSPISRSKALLFAMSSGNLNSVRKKIEKIHKKHDLLVLFCAKVGYLAGADYFYEKIKNKDNIYHKALTFINAIENDSYEFEQRQELLLFLLKKKPEEERKEFILKYFPQFYLIFLESWPYVPISMELLKYWDCLPLPTQVDVFELTMKFLMQSLPFNELSAYFSIYQPVLENILQITSLPIKHFHIRGMEWVFKFFEKSNYSAIETIVNDPDLKKYRSVLLDINRNLASYLKREDGNYQNIEKYMRALKFSENEKRSLLKFCEDPHKVPRELLRLGHFNNMEKVITWHLYLKGEEVTKDKVQKFIDPFILIGYDKFDMFKKYFNWVCGDDPEELKKLKTKIFSRELIAQNFWIFWMKVYHFANRKEKCKEFFNYIFQTEDDLLYFKKTVVESEKFPLTLLDPKTYRYSCLRDMIILPSSLDEIYLDIFSVSPEKVAEIKMEIKNNIDGWFDLYNGKFLFLAGIIKWISNDYEEKNKIRKRFIESSKGTLLCFNVIKAGLGTEGSTRSDHHYSQVAKHVLRGHKWIDGEESIRKIRGRIQDLRGSEDVNDVDVDRVVQEFDRIFLV